MKFLKNNSKMVIAIAVVAAGGLVFQVAHFFEHFAQAAAWIFGPNKTELYMTPWAMDLVMWFGDMFKNRTMEAREVVGMEVLHFFGNLLFLIGLIAYRYFDKSLMAKWALIAQSIHMFEHILLTASAVWIGYPIGFTTLFGMPMSPATLSGIRGVVHFILNLIPSWMIGIALWKKFKNN